MNVLTDPFYPDNYIVDILGAERKYDYVLIPTSMHVIRQLREKYGRKVVLCYPADELREEYKKRFIARGNSEDFLDLFIEMWDRFLGPVREFRDAVHIVMGAGEYLTDLKERFDRELLSDDTKPIPEETIAPPSWATLRNRPKLFCTSVAVATVIAVTSLSLKSLRFILAVLVRKTARSYLKLQRVRSALFCLPLFSSC